jgi:two-component system cell cycle response regulator PopA
VADKARILILTRDGARLAPLAEGLARLGWPTEIERGLFAGVAALGDAPAEAVIVDLVDEARETLSWPRRLKSAAAPRRLPVLAIGEPSPELVSHGYDLVLAPPLRAAAVAHRLETFVRLAVAEEEFELRVESFAERGRRLDAPEQDLSPVKALCVGEPAPEFLALSNALTVLGAHVVGAFTSFTAFDYLHERPFDAVVLWGGGQAQEALTVIAGMRRNTRLYHIPALLYERGANSPSADEAFRKGVTDVASGDVTEAETAARVMELARAYRRQTAIRRALERARSTSGLVDGAGLFTRELFAAHLTRLALATQSSARALSVCVLRLADRPQTTIARAGGWLDRAIPQIGGMISRLVRVEDTAARLGPEVFALALPSTSRLAAQLAAERIAAVIACTAFDSGPGRDPFTAEFDIGVAEVKGPRGAAGALEMAAAEASGRRKTG